MFKNYVKSAVRALLKYKGTTLINILGLTIGFCSVIMISIYVFNEINYDRFHDKSDRILRLGVEGKMTGSHMVSYENRVFAERSGNLLFSDSTFFNIFSFKLLQGDPDHVLTDPYSIVLTEKTARKFFGDADPIGKSLTVDSKETIYRVTGIVEDPPVNSHFHFRYLAALHSREELKRDNWLSHNFYTYVLLKPGTDSGHFTESLSGLLDKYIAPVLMQMLNLSLKDVFAQGSTFKYISIPLTKIHLNSHKQYEIEPTGNKTYVIIFSALALLILVVAGINFINLATARSNPASVFRQ